MMLMLEASETIWEVGMVVLESPVGRSVHVIDEGSGPAVVFLHSGVGSPGEWRSVFERWSGQHRLIAIDV
jgi:lipase